MAKIEIEHGLPGQFGGMARLEEEPPVEWLIKDWLAARELTVLYGKGGTFKSYIALAWTLQLARSGVPCLYVAAEGTSGLRSRVDAWLAARRISEHLPSWHYYNANVHVDQPKNLHPWLGGLRDYLKAAKAVDPELIVVDTLARNFSGDESSPRDVGVFVEGCEHLRRTMDAAILVIHHMGVGTGRERGTAALRNATFAMLKTGDPRFTATGGGSVDLECDRMKDAPLPDKVRVRFDTVALGADEYGAVYQVSQAMRTFPPRGKQRAKGVIKP